MGGEDHRVVERVPEAFKHVVKKGDKLWTVRYRKNISCTTANTNLCEHDKVHYPLRRDDDWWKGEALLTRPEQRGNENGWYVETLPYYKEEWVPVKLIVKVEQNLLVIPTNKKRDAKTTDEKGWFENMVAIHNEGRLHELVF